MLVLFLAFSALSDFFTNVGHNRETMTLKVRHDLAVEKTQN